MKMKKSAMAIAAAALMLASCSQNKTENTTDTASITPDPVAEEVVVEQIDTTGYTTTASGLRYKVIKKGAGETPTATSNVTVHYTGKHLDGRVFDSSVERNEPATFPLNQVIKGWTEGVQLMQPGAVYEFIIPSELGYGANGTPDGSIKPDETLYFRVELISIDK